MTTFGWLFPLAIVAALGAMGYRRWRRRRLAERVLALPGRAADHALAARSYREMDELLRQLPCTCGGAATTLGERTAWHEGREQRVVRMECLHCGERFSVYFDLSALPH